MAKAATQTQSVRLTVRVTPKERKEIERAAAAGGHESVEELIRALLEGYVEGNKVRQ